MPAVEDGDLLTGTVLSQAHLTSLVRHADDDQANAGPRVEPVVHQPQLGHAGRELEEAQGGADAATTSV
jgi:hypothetical protein